MGQQSLIANLCTDPLLFCCCDVAELKQVVSKRDIGIRALEAMLATARPHSALQSQPSLPPRESSPAAADNFGHFSTHGRSSNGPGSSEGHVAHVRFSDQHGSAALPVTSESGAQGEAYFGGLTEAEWKLVMLAGKVAIWGRNSNPNP